MYRWGATDGSIPINIRLKSFESHAQGRMVHDCLGVVLRTLNETHLGPKFHLVETCSESAFFVARGTGRRSSYASSFFPSPDPWDWYICIYDLGLSLGKDHFIKVLTHEMLHVLGVRHCDVDSMMENEPYLRYPHGLSDHENWDFLMQPQLGPSDLSRYDLEPRTFKDIREFYSMKVGTIIDGHEIEDVSWRVGERL